MAGQWFSPGIPYSSTNKTDRHDITEILLKVALNTIILTPTRLVLSINICRFAVTQSDSPTFYSPLPKIVFIKFKKKCLFLIIFLWRSQYLPKVSFLLLNLCVGCLTSALLTFCPSKVVSQEGKRQSNLLLRIIQLF